VVFWDHDEHIPDDVMADLSNGTHQINMHLNVSMFPTVIDLLRHGSNLVIGFDLDKNRAYLS